MMNSDERQRRQRPEHLDDRVDRVPHHPAGGHARPQGHPDGGARREADQDRRKLVAASYHSGLPCDGYGCPEP